MHQYTNGCLILKATEHVPLTSVHMPFSSAYPRNLKGHRAHAVKFRQNTFRLKKRTEG